MELKQLMMKKVAFKPQLLIVPYGIETELTIVRATDGTAFNRTLWN